MTNFTTVTKKVQPSFKNPMGKSILKKTSITIGIFFLVMIFNLITKGVFASQRNISLLLRQGAVLMMVTSGILMLLISRNFDLSAGSAVYLVSVLVAQFTVVYKINLAMTIILAILLGLAMGAIQGFFIGYVRVPAFIATLAGYMVFRGIGYVWTDAATIGPIPETLARLSEGYISKSASVIILIFATLAAISYFIWEYRKLRQWYGGIDNLIFKIIFIALLGVVFIWIFCGYLGIPTAVFLAALVALAISFISNKTVFGRHLYIIGGNPEAAKLAGINTSKRIFQSYLLMGIIYGLSGILITARLGGSTASTAQLIELDAVAAAVIGGTSMSGGIGKISGVMIGVIILSAIDNIMSLMNVSSYLQMVVKGLILLAAVCFDAFVSNPKLLFKLQKEKSLEVNDAKFKSGVR